MVTFVALSAVLVMSAPGCSQTHVDGARAPEGQLPGDTPPSHTPAKSESDHKVAKKTDSIGQATMNQDGTIVLQLRAEGDDGTVGDALFTYPPTHEDYKMILEHLGGLEPGQSKPVPPWPDEK